MKMKDIIERFKIIIRQHIRQVRIEQFHEHSKYCPDCKLGWTVRCKEGKELLEKCLGTSEN